MAMTYIVQHEPERGQEFPMSQLWGDRHDEYDLREWRHGGRDPREEHRRADRSKRVVHLPREQRERCSERRAHRCITRERE